MLVWADRVMEYSITTGTGAYTLAGAIAGFQTFAAVGNANTCYYCAYEVDVSGSPSGGWEVGIGTYTASGTTFARTLVFASTNSNVAVNWGAGTRRLIVTQNASSILAFVQPSSCDFRLTLSSGLAVTTADVTAAAAIYFTPFQQSNNGVIAGYGRFSLWNGTNWQLYQSAETQYVLASITSGVVYDMFIYDKDGTLTLEPLAWASGTARATALDLRDGVLVQHSAQTKRYLGTFKASGTNTAEDSMAKRFLWNNYNRAWRKLKRVETNSSWTYSSATVHQTNANAANQVEVVIGVPGLSMIDLMAYSAMGSTLQENGQPVVGIGENSTTTMLDTPAYLNLTYPTIGTAVMVGPAKYNGPPPLGFSFYSWNEAFVNVGAAAGTWYGTGVAGNLTPGLYGSIMM